MRTVSLLILSFFCTNLLTAQGSADSLQQYYQARVLQYLDKDNVLSGYYAINSRGITIYSSPAAKKKDSAEFFLSWQYLENFRERTKYFDSTFYKRIYCRNGWKEPPGPSFTDTQVKKENSISPLKPLQGKKIAIDPGHIGGKEEDARMERKIVKPGDDTILTISPDSELIEGNLTMQTALLLKKKLEEQGATVMLTREKEGQNAFGYSFSTWMKKDFKNAVDFACRNREISKAERKKLLDPGTKKEYIYQHFFLQEDLKKRAAKINAFKPDLSIVVHYNADETNTRWQKTSERNFNMVFIPGSFMEDEMQSKRNRFEFLRLLTRNDIEISEQAADKLIASFVKKLDVPAACENDATYLRENCISTGAKGVFCRNLALTRFIHGPVVYGETLYQDNEKEFRMLSNQLFTINGVRTSVRVSQVADAYYEGTMAFFK